MAPLGSGLGPGMSRDELSLRRHCVPAATPRKTPGGKPAQRHLGTEPLATRHKEALPLARAAHPGTWGFLPVSKLAQGLEALTQRLLSSVPGSAPSGPERSGQGNLSGPRASQHRGLEGG